MFKSLLVPLDGTPESNVALPLARTLARATGASLTLLRVLPPPSVPEQRAAADEARHTLERIAHELGGDDLEVQYLVRFGNPADEIVAQCAAQSADLMVMRTHGRAGFGRAVLGSVTERVMQSSHVPLLVLRAGGRKITHLGTLIVPVDGSPGGAVGLGTALQLARATGASLKLLEVVVPLCLQVYPGYELGGMAYFNPDWDDEALEAARTYVAGLVSRIRGDGTRADGEARMAPNVAQAIVDLAESAPADLIVMSTQALTGPARAILGSVADAVIRNADCPVLLLHRPPSTDAASTQGEAESDAALEAAVAGA